MVLLATTCLPELFDRSDVVFLDLRTICITICLQKNSELRQRALPDIIPGVAAPGAINTVLNSSLWTNSWMWPANKSIIVCGVPSGATTPNQEMKLCSGQGHVARLDNTLWICPAVEDFTSAAEGFLYFPLDEHPSTCSTNAWSNDPRDLAGSVALTATNRR